MNLFCGDTITPVLDFWWRRPGVSKPGWIPHLHAFLPACNGFFRFTSGATPADILTASMSVGHIRHMHVAEVRCQDLIERLLHSKQICYPLDHHVQCNVLKQITILTQVLFWHYRPTLPLSFKGWGPHHFPIPLNTSALNTCPPSLLLSFPLRSP